MSSRRVLIVEDQREVSRLLRSALETLEHELEIVEIFSAEEALLDISRNSIDLLVADYRLPGVTGIDLMHKVRKLHPNVKVILITGVAAPKVRKEVAEAGADAFFLKPVPIADFLDAAERHLGFVETMFPPEPIVAEEEKPQCSLPNLLAQLRLELGATAVLLLNDGGGVLARAGNLPDSHDETSLLSALLAVHSAGQEISHMLGQSAPTYWSAFQGRKYDLVFVPAGMSYALLAVGKRLAAEERLAKTKDVISRVCHLIVPALEEGPAATVSVQEQPETPAEASGDLESFLKVAPSQLKPAEMDDFWDKAATPQQDSSGPDILSFDQAKRLGLAPKDEAGDEQPGSDN